MCVLFNGKKQVSDKMLKRGNNMGRRGERCHPVTRQTAAFALFDALHH